MDQATKTLTMTYAAEPGTAGLAATAGLKAANTTFDLQVTVENHLGKVLSSMLVPADLVGSADGVTAGYAPNFLPGIRLGPGFFKGPRQRPHVSGPLGVGRLPRVRRRRGPFRHVHGQPGAEPAAADRARVRPRRDRQLLRRHGFCVAHSFDTWVADGATWQSPTVRIRVGDTVDKSLAGFRTDNALDRYPSSPTSSARRPTRTSGRR